VTPAERPGSGTLRSPDVFQSEILLEGQKGIPRLVAFTSDGRHLVSGDERGEIRLWDLPAAGLGNVILLRGHRARIDQIAINSGGRRLLTGDANGETRLWDLAAEKIENKRRRPSRIRSMDREHCVHARRTMAGRQG